MSVSTKTGTFPILKKAGFLNLLRIWISIAAFTSLSFAGPEEIEKILQQPENKIDVGEACLVLSKDAYPDIDIKQCLFVFDNMTKGVEEIIAYSKDKMSLPDKRIGAMNTFLFRPGPWNAIGRGKNMVFKYDDEHVDKLLPQSFFLPYMLFEHKGTCATMPTLWYILADRLKWPVNAVRGPMHVWVRYRGIKEGNIETTSNCGYIPDSQYCKDFRIGKKAVQNGIYLAPLTRKNFISTLLVNNAYYSTNVLRDTGRAIRYLKIAVKYDAKNMEALSGLGILIKDNSLIRKALSLGLTDHKYSDEFYEKRKKQLDNEKEQP